MAQINRAKPAIETHEGGKARHINAELKFRRSVLSCMLWEDTFYEDGVVIADRIEELALAVESDVAVSVAIEARENMHLRHVPLLIAVALARRGALKAGLLERIIQRPDELTEFLAIYWRDGRCPLSAQVKKGLARAFVKFNRYSLAKYNNTDKEIKLRDVLFLSHPKPVGAEQVALFQDLVNGTLKSADTWETSLSISKDGKKKTTEDKGKHWTRLITEGKLGGLATLRNLRNFQDVGLSDDLIRKAIAKANYSKVLPFRFIAAARYAVSFEPELEEAMFRVMQERPKLRGTTAVLVDVSGSMHNALSGKSDMLRIDAANGIAMCLREICEHVKVYSFSTELVEIPARRGFGLRDAINGSQEHYSTYLKAAINGIPDGYDRLVVITDEQSHDGCTDRPHDKNAIGYMINVAAYENGVGYGGWIHMDGFSEAVLDWIIELEAL